MSEQVLSKSGEWAVVPVHQKIRRDDFAALPGCEPKPVTELTGKWVGETLFSIRCDNSFQHPSHVMVILRKSEPEPKPATQTIVFHEVIVQHVYDNGKSSHLTWVSEIPEHHLWIPTGRTETREVVR